VDSPARGVASSTLLTGQSDACERRVEKSIDESKTEEIEVRSAGVEVATKAGGTASPRPAAVDYCTIQTCIA
jgi:hypothetical protein